MAIERDKTPEDQEQADALNYEKARMIEDLEDNYREVAAQLRRMRDSNLFDARKCAVAITQTDIARLCAVDAGNSDKV
jgi:hypothetical protein